MSRDSKSFVTPESLRPLLARCGYSDTLLSSDFNFGGGVLPLVGFSNAVHDSRSICIAIIKVFSDSNIAEDVKAIRQSGAPVVLVCNKNRLDCWKQTTSSPVHIESIPKGNISNFFKAHKGDFDPQEIYRGKTIGRMSRQGELKFIDAGLMPQVEKEAGNLLSKHLESIILGIEKTLGHSLKKDEVKDAFRPAFWLLAAKMLQDKKVSSFNRLDLTDIDSVFDRVGRHYGEADGMPPKNGKWREAILEAAKTTARFSHLGSISTEVLAHVYENTLVPKNVRKQLGIHSTPSALIDYMIWQMWPWVSDIPEEDRHVFEPACGHAGFLVGMLRQLSQWSNIEDGKQRHKYLREHLHGIEIDPFAREIAKLSLTLADIPYGNSWDIQQGDMFEGDALQRQSSRARILLANPPYEKFTAKEKAYYSKSEKETIAISKACEMLNRTIPHLADNACFGVVVPLALLHSKEGNELRKGILEGFELAEISLFEDRLFEHGQSETAMIRGRRKVAKSDVGSICYRRVRNSEMSQFRSGEYVFSSVQKIHVSDLSSPPMYSFDFPELSMVWDYLKNNPVLSSYVSVGKGVEFKGASSRPDGSWTVRATRPNDKNIGYYLFGEDIEIFETPESVSINLSPEVVYCTAKGSPTGIPRVLLNYGRVSRGQWKLKALLDENGRAITKRIIALSPKAGQLPVNTLWAIMNSPVANAFAYCMLVRDIAPRVLKQMPLPMHLFSHATSIENAATKYRKLASENKSGPMFGDNINEYEVKQALLEMDAAVMKAYDLPPKLERQLLDLFAGAERKGVGCEFDGYYPEDMNAYIPLHELISEEYARSTAGSLRERHKPTDNPEYIAALKMAAESFGED